MSDPAFIAGIFTGLIVAACIAGLYGFLMHFRQPRRDPIDWEERSYAPPAVTTIQTANRRREISL